MKGSNAELVLFRELHGIRRLIEQYVASQEAIASRVAANGYDPRVSSLVDYELRRVPSERRAPAPEPVRIAYENVTNTMRELLARRPSTERDQPLLPSQIDPTLRSRRRPPPAIPSTTLSPAPTRDGPLTPRSSVPMGTTVTTPPTTIPVSAQDADDHVSVYDDVPGRSTVRSLGQFHFISVTNG